jgi:hypothetical protein
MRGVEKTMKWSIIGCIALALYEAYRTWEENENDDDDYEPEEDSTDDGDDPAGDGGETIIEL